MSTTLRRNRFKVQPKGGNFKITENDLAILSLFNTYEYLPSTFIMAKIPWLARGYIANRLTTLNHELQLIRVPKGSTEAANARYRPLVYSRTQKGTDLLIARGWPVDDPRSGEPFPHAFGVSLIAASLDIGIEAHPPLLGITTDDILNHKACPPTTRNSAEPLKVKAPFTFKGKKGKPIPVEDAHIVHDWHPMGIEHELADETIRIFLPGFEFDRSNEPLESSSYKRSSIEKKFCQVIELCKEYDEVDGYQEHYGITDVFIPFWTINETHMRNMMKLLHRVTKGKGSERILFGYMSDFSTYEAIPEATGWALTYNYKRVGPNFGKKTESDDNFNFLEELGIEEKTAA